METTKQKLLSIIGTMCEDSGLGMDAKAFAEAYAILCAVERDDRQMVIQEKMTNYGMNHCPECGKHDELDTEEIG